MNGIAPTVPLVHSAAKTELDFKGSTTSLRRILKRMGYKYGGIDNSLIQSDKVFVSGWKEKNLKTRVRAQRSKNKPQKKSSAHENHVIATAQMVPQLLDSDGVIASEDLVDIGSHEVIIHYQKPEDAFLTGTAHNQIIAVTAEPTELIQLQLDANGTPMNVVQEWHWQPCQQETFEMESS